TQSQAQQQQTAQQTTVTNAPAASANAPTKTLCQTTPVACQPGNNGDGGSPVPRTYCHQDHTCGWPSPDNNQPQPANKTPVGTTSINWCVTSSCGSSSGGSGQTSAIRSPIGTTSINWCVTSSCAGSSNG